MLRLQYQLYPCERWRLSLAQTSPAITHTSLQGRKKKKKKWCIKLQQKKITQWPVALVEYIYVYKKNLSADEWSTKTDPRKYLKVRDLFWTGFITGLWGGRNCAPTELKHRGRLPNLSGTKCWGEPKNHRPPLLLFLQRRIINNTTRRRGGTLLSTVEEGGRGADFSFWKTERGKKTSGS